MNVRSHFLETGYWSKLALIAGLILVYALFFESLYQSARFAFLLPLVLTIAFVAGWLLGLRGGLIVAGVILLLNIVLLTGVNGFPNFFDLAFVMNAVFGVLLLLFTVMTATFLQYQFAINRALGAMFPFSAISLRALLSNVPIIFFAVDKNGILTLSEGKGLEDLGLKPGQAVGRSFFEMYAHIDNLINDVRRTLAGETHSSIVPGPGKTAYETFYFPTRDSHNNIIGMIAFAIDVTSRQQAEEAYRILVDNSLQGLYIIDTDMHMRFANNKMAEFMGYSIQELTSMSGEQVQALIYEDDRPLVTSRAASIMSKQQVSLRGEARYIRKNGEIRWLESYATRTSYLGKPALQIVCIDITQRKINENKAREAERLQLELDKERELKEHKRRFISTVTHEFRTPLTIISTSAYLLQRNIQNMSPEKSTEYFGKIQAQIKWLDAMVDNMLALHREEESPMEFAPFPVDVKALSQDLAAEMQAAVGANQIIVFTAPETAPAVLLDPRLLRHIITNLLSNAIKYSPGGGEINFDLSLDDQNIIFKITDRGIGISPEDQKHIFDSFQRGSNVGEIKGTGLGLKIVKDYVDLHNGRITIDSATGQGTTFTIYLPRTPAPV